MLLALLLAGARAHAQPAPERVAVKLLALNDFHGQLSPKLVSGRPIGGAATLASYIKAAASGAEHVFIVHAGDHVGASPANSALLQDEPAISFLNTLAGPSCVYGRARQPKCNVIGTLGNHEFDRGQSELLRLIQGGNHEGGPFLEPRWRGARFGYVSANVVLTKSKRPLLEPFTVQRIPGAAIGFIGAVLRGAPLLVRPSGVAKLTFLDEADSINRAARQLQKSGVRAIVVLIHQGLEQPRYEGTTRPEPTSPGGELLEIIRKLDDSIDVVVSGHSHEFTNALVPNANGVPILVTQAFSAGAAIADIDLQLDKRSGEVLEKTARIVGAWADQGPGLTPDPQVAALVARADARVAERVNVAIGTAAAPIRRNQNVAGESALGNLIADAQRAAMGSDFALINPGGIRADIEAGPVTWGEIFSVQPFRNQVIELTLTGQQLYDLLNQQWGGEQPPGGRMLQISGFGYTWDSSVPEGGLRVIEIHDARGPISREASYRLSANAFLAEGGDGFRVLTSGTYPRTGPVDLDILADYLKNLPQPFNAHSEGRIQRR
ncbi:MAG TPA: bifunctional metallophosphatase/5'-nucleotidase [Polyangiales bacterium]|nr:bifunctional metallophosphatase/5'-nucleotidase [Polyangiales bacterium]